MKTTKVLEYFFIVFFIAIWPIIDSGSVRIWSIMLSLIFLILGILNSKILSSKIRIKLVKFLEKLLSNCYGLFIFIITPIGILMR